MSDKHTRDTRMDVEHIKQRIEQATGATDVHMRRSVIDDWQVEFASPNGLRALRRNLEAAGFDVSNDVHCAQNRWTMYLRDTQPTPALDAPTFAVGQRMSDKRTMTAVQLTAPTDEAASVWNGVRDGELSVSHFEQDAKVNVFGFTLHDGKIWFDTEYEGIYDTYPLPPDEPMLVEPTRLGKALAERDALRQAAEALLACFVFDDENKYVSTELRNTRYIYHYYTDAIAGARGYTLHKAALALRDALKGDATHR